MSQAEPQKGQAPSASAVEMNELLLPTHANSLGNAFGGQIMAWVDICAAMAAQRHARRIVVTAAIDAVSFIAPIRVGQLVNLQAKVNAVGRTSMEVGVRVEAEEPLTGERVHALDAYVTFVALGPSGRPTGIPPLIMESAEDELRRAEAQVRREKRLELAEAHKRLRQDHRD